MPGIQHDHRHILCCAEGIYCRVLLLSDSKPKCSGTDTRHQCQRQNALCVAPFQSIHSSHTLSVFPHPELFKAMKLPQEI